MIKERIGAVAVFHAKIFHFPGLLRMNLKDIYPGNMEKLENWALFKFWDDEEKKELFENIIRMLQNVFNGCVT